MSTLWAMDFRTLNERLGKAFGNGLALVTGAVAAARRARMFHPEGIVLRGQLESVAAPDWASVGQRVSGPALVRLSSAWWRGGKEWIDALGIAVRLQRDEVDTEQVRPSDQDLLFATIRYPWTTLLAPLSTHVHDFLSNDYYAVSPFEVPEVGRVKWRLVSAGTKGEPFVPDGLSREHRLLAALEAGAARFRLELQRQSPKSEWIPVAELQLTRVLHLDQESLRFSPFHTGRGIEPRGFVHALRNGTYRASQAFRPGHEGA